MGKINRLNGKKDVFNHIHCGLKGIFATFEWMNRGISLQLCGKV